MSFGDLSLKQVEFQVCNKMLGNEHTVDILW